MTNSSEKLDLIIFGATGYTGKVAVYKVLKLAKEKNITWGIAGRTQNKLDAVLKEVAEKTGEDLANISVVLADLSDESSIQQMVLRARVIVNCVGPYTLYGEQVVSACVANGTHHVDISGEMEYMEMMQLKYHEATEKNGAYIVSACGFDSVPADLGTVYMMKNFDGDLNSVEAYLTFRGPRDKQGTTVAHSGTWESIVHAIGNLRNLRSLRQKLFRTSIPALTPKLKLRSLVHKRESVKGWSVPLFFPDRAVVTRSQRHFFEHDKLRPVQIQNYFTLPSLFSVVLITIAAAIIFILSQFQFGRKLLIKYPRLFSGGFLSHEGPTVEDREKTSFTIKLFGEGWKEKLAEPTDQHHLPPNKHMVVQVSGKDPGYGFTSETLLLTAITILKESDKMPGRGGVLPPAAAFAKTSLLEELQKHGMKFEIVSSTGTQ